MPAIRRSRYSFLQRWGQNFLKSHRMEVEDKSETLQSGQIKRGAYAKIIWQF